MTTTTLNPSDKAPAVALSNGNLTATTTTSSGAVRGTTTGVAERYFEVTFTSMGGGGVGVANASQTLATGYPGDPNGVGWFYSAYAEWPGSGTSNLFQNFVTGDVLGVLLKTSGVQFYKNGTLVGTATALPAGALYPIIQLSANSSAVANFGATPLAHLPQNATSWDGSQSNFGAGWNSADKNAGIQLSNNNLTAAYSTTNPSGNVNVRGSIAAQPNRYFEVKFSTLVDGQAHTAGLGLANATQLLSAYPGDPNGAAWFKNGYAEWPGSGTANNFGAFAAGDVLGVLIKSTGTATATSGPPDFSIADFASSDFFAGGSTSGNMTDFSPSDFGFDFSGGAAGTGASGTYSLTGYPATTVKSKPLSPATGSYVLTGRAAALRDGRKIVAAKGTYTLLGKPATLAHSGFKLIAGAGTYTRTGRAASMQGGIPIRSGVFTVTGNAATITLIKPYGDYRLTGGNAGLRIGEAANSGAYTLTGRAAVTGHGHGMLLGSGSFKLSGAQLTPIADGDTSALFERRLKSLIPRGWVLRTAPIFDAVLGGLGDSLANFYTLLKSVKQQTRIATASGWFLDLIGWDFLGTNYLRKNKETDDRWRARIVREVLRPRATRLGIETALEDLTGLTPKIYEPWNAADDGGGYGAVGGGIAYGQSGYYGSVVLPAQVFVTAYKTGLSGIPNITGYGYGNGGYGTGTIAYASLTEVEGEISDAEIFDCVHQNIAAGAKAWVAIGAVPRRKSHLAAGSRTFAMTGRDAAMSHTSPLLTESFSVIQTEDGFNLEASLNP